MPALQHSTAPRADRLNPESAADSDPGPNRTEGKGEYSTLRALGENVASCSAVYFWPKQKRLLGKAGILHVKCAAADGEWLFLSSANLTHQAFNINMELGVLVRGGTAPRQVETQFEQLIRMDILEAV